MVDSRLNLTVAGQYDKKPLLTNNGCDCRKKGIPVAASCLFSDEVFGFEK